MQDEKSPIIENLKHQTKRKRSGRSTFTDKDNNFKEYYFCVVPSLPFKIEVWEKQKVHKSILGELTFSSIAEILNKSENESYSLNTTRLKSRIFVRIQWSLKED